MALYNKGVTLRSLGRSEEALAVYDAAEERFGRSEEPALQGPVARALFNKGATLGSLGRSEEALAVYDAVVERFGHREEPALQESVAWALFNKGVRLGSLGRSEEALAAFMTVLGRTTRGEELRLRVVRGVLLTLSRQEALLEKGVSALKQDAESLSGGLMQWIQGLLPMSREDAESLGACESVLRRVLADVPSCQPALQMLAVIRRDALGDNRALLELPLELRRLIKTDDEETQGAPRGTHDAPRRGRDGRRKGAKT
jgi:tetratricopeptide (TPR) repeat protein